MKLPLIRSLAIAPARTPFLRYGVALLSTCPGADPNLVFLRYRREPPRRFRRRGHGQRLVWRMEARPRRYLFCAHRQRLLLVHRRTDSRRISQRDRPPRLVFRRGPAHLLVQRRPSRCPGQPAPIREQLPLAGHECALRHLPVQRPRNPAGRKSTRWWLCLVMPAPPNSRAGICAAFTPMPSNGFKLPIIFAPERNSTT